MDGLKSTTFWYIFLISYLSQLFSFCTMTNFNIIGSRNLNDEKFLTLVIGNINCVLFAIFKPIAGILTDRLGHQKCMIVIYAV